MGSKSLLIVESPSKARTIKKYLGPSFDVTASVGHVKDLPKNKIGVDVTKDFEPEYVTIRGKNKIIKEIRTKAKAAETIFLAPDPDREGEAIAWHLAGEILQQNKDAKIFRVLINEITKKGVKAAIGHPQKLNRERYESQQTRRILDRLVGYTISPILWDKVRRGLSAGRVQSVAVRLIVDREAEIEAFDPKEYWSIEAHLEGSDKPSFWSNLHRIDTKKVEVDNGADAQSLVDAAEAGSFVVKTIVRQQRSRNPAPPFTTSKIQQAAAHRLRFTAKKTMQVAQRLYEGLDLGPDGAVGLITYMRTDSTRISDDALAECRDFIKQEYGAAFLSPKPRVFKAKKGAQDAHEAIRPTSMKYPPAQVKQYLTRDQFVLYRLIWNRFVACQMASAKYDQTSIDIENGDLIFRASGSIMTFAGHLKIYEETTKGENDGKTLPPIKEGEVLECHEIKSTQHFTQPPPRFTEATLVKELEEKGIGRPSTYASIISTIQSKGYTEKNKSQRFQPTELGAVVTGLLIESFPRILDAGFTARMEEQLDGIEEGNLNWIEVLKDFYTPFSETLEEAKTGMRNIKRETVETDVKCGECGKPMVIKWGKNGYFLACSGYPECRSTCEFERTEDGTIKPVVEEIEVAGVCDKCGGDMVVKSGRYGRFLACSNYPECKNTKGIAVGVPCPKCGKDIVEKKSRRGKQFFGCSGYPECKFALWDRPVAIACKACETPYLLEKSRRSGTFLQCNECGEKYSPDEFKDDATSDDG